MVKGKVIASLVELPILSQACGRENPQNEAVAQSRKSSVVVLLLLAGGQAASEPHPRLFCQTLGICPVLPPFRSCLENRDIVQRQIKMMVIRSLTLSS